MPLLLSYCGRLRYIHALEVVPYGKSSVERARVKAARAAQRDDAADRATLRTRVSLPARSARTRAWSKPGFASAPVENFPRRVVDKTNLN